MKMRKAWWWAFVLFLSGCTSYQPKASEDTARLRFVTYQRGTASIHVWDADSPQDPKLLVVQVVGNLLSPISSKLDMMGEPEEGAANATEILLPANRNLRISVSATWTTPERKLIRCLVAFDFNAKRDGQFEVQYRTIEAGTRCLAASFELTQGDGGKVTRTIIGDLP